MKLLSKVLTLCFTFCLLTACDTVVEVSPGKELDTDKLADLIEQRLKGNCVGYQFTIGFKGENKVMRAGGDARLAPDANPRAMLITDRYTLASVSKNITATALMQLLAAKGLTLDTKLAPYLPAHWKVSASLQTVTFRQLLTHTSNLYDAQTDYQTLKNFADTATRNSPTGYRNVNYALLRFAIVHLSGKTVTSLPNNATSSQRQQVEAKQAQEYGDNYVAYCQENIFGKIGSYPNVNCKQLPDSDNPGLCYQFPKDGKNGEPWGDLTTLAASQGWYMTSAQLASYFGKLMYSTQLLPSATTTQMRTENIGMFSGQTPKGLACYSHNGYYPGQGYGNKGELNTIIIGYDNGIQIALIINSQYSNPAFNNNYTLALHDAIDTWNK
ncbi:serine hydrolase [Xanthocytophaga agilis]|uniref:Serine hydrolase n=1 Tax=Xanthocytophaga agilis TaxID=3048010 RepID=A0AAE3UIR8_9BACT|nr:serine hydrolase [Xanthocytophaga agilis]MDJ1504782.1 serine hydrolase [Xanthocytophaga agilis]